MVDPKGKVPETPSSNPHKKQKKTEAFVGGESKKAKLMASKLSATGTNAVYFELFLEYRLRLASVLSATSNFLF